MQTIMNNKKRQLQQQKMEKKNFRNKVYHELSLSFSLSQFDFAFDTCMWRRVYLSCIPEQFHCPEFYYSVLEFLEEPLSSLSSSCRTKDMELMEKSFIAAFLNKRNQGNKQGNEKKQKQVVYCIDDSDDDAELEMIMKRNFPKMSVR